MTELTDHDKLTQIHAVLLGVNGNPGLCKLVERNTKSIQKLWILIAIIIASMGGGLYGIWELFKG